MSTYEDIRNILNRIDGVNAPVQELDDKERTMSTIKHSSDKNVAFFDKMMKRYGPNLMELIIDHAHTISNNEQKGKEKLKKWDKEDDLYLSDYYDQLNHVDEDLLTMLSTAAETNAKLIDLFYDKVEQAKKRGDFSKTSRLEDPQGYVNLSREPKGSPEYAKFRKKYGVKEDAGEDEKVVDMLRNIKQHLDNHPNMSEHPSLVALDQLADDLESGDKPADYESTSEDSGELSRLKELSGIEEGHYPHIKSFDKLYGINDMQQYKAMADDAQSMDMGEFMDTYSSVIDMAGDFWEDHQKTSESNENVVNEDPNTLAKELASEIMKYVRKGFDHIPADALKAKAKEYLSSIKESAVKEDLDSRSEDILNKAGFDPADIDTYMKVFNDHGDTSDLEQMNMKEKVGLAEVMSMVLASHGIQNESYQPFPEADEFDIEEDEDFEEVLGPLGFPEDELWEAEYRGRKVPLNKPMRGDVKKFKVYVKDPKTGNVKKVNFGHGGTSAKKLGQKTMKIRKSNPKARKSFRARHNCANPGPKTKARYWSCRKW